MNFIKLILKNIIYYRKNNFTVLIGTILGVSIITSALVIGDSVKNSLHNIVEQRLGNTSYVISANGKFFPTNLSEKLDTILKTEIAPVLITKGIATNEEGKNKINNVQIIGINQQFEAIANWNSFEQYLNEDNVIVNEKLAKTLNLNCNDEFVLKIKKTNYISTETPFSSDENNSVSIRLKIMKIVGENHLGNFNLENSQITPYNIFLSLSKLNKLIDADENVNFLLIKENTKNSESEIRKSLQTQIEIQDLNLIYKKLESPDISELTSKYIFIEDTLVKIAQTINSEVFPILTYFINFIKKDTLSTPYSFVCGIGEQIIPDLGESEIIVNEWIANDLHLKTNDTVVLDYYIVNNLRKLRTEKRHFKIRAIIPISGIAADKTLMPEFKGIAEAETCNNWDAGIPIDFKLIRKKDEEYWKTYRGTPKAFINYSTAKKLWQNKFGTATAIRFSDSIDNNYFASELLKKYNIDLAGFQINNIKDKALFASDNGVSFSQLFIGLGFFLIIASIILTTLLHSLSIDLRIKELGILQSLGFPKTKIQKILLSESILISIFGSAIGCLLGVLLTKFLITILNSNWNDIIRTQSLYLFLNSQTIAISFLTGLFIAISISLINIYKKRRYSIYDLQKNNLTKPKNQIIKHIKFGFVIFILLISIVSLIAFYGFSQDFQNPVFFNITGIVLFVVLLVLTNIFLNIISIKKFSTITLTILALKTIAYKKKQNFWLITTTAIGLFIVLTTGFNRKNPLIDETISSSGTGGFQWYAETTFPITTDLNTEDGKEKYGLTDLDSTNFSQLKVVNGDDASCLNLNKISKPRIIGINPTEFKTRNAFSFALVEKDLFEHFSWENLDDNLGEAIFPAIADQTVIKWGLGKSIGDTIIYQSELGDTLRFKLIAGLESSIFQGNLIISEKILQKNFPSIDGATVLLIESKKKDTSFVRRKIEEALRNNGVIIGTTKHRLSVFNSVTNTYLNIFLVLGALGMIIGTCGIAIILFKNLFELRKQISMLNAIGLKKAKLFVWIFITYGIILLLGTAFGILASVISSFSALHAQIKQLPIAVAILLILVFIFNNFVWLAFATNLGLKGKIIHNLMND